MIGLAVVVVLLVAVGYPFAARLTGSRKLGLVVAPGCTALACTAAAVISTATRTPLLPWVLAAIVALWALRRFVGRGAMEGPDGRMLLLLVGLSVWPMLTVLQAPIGWDARGIWWLHAEWFLAGGERAAEAMANPAFTLAHPDYPPLAPATTAAVWRLLGTDSLSVAQSVSGVLGYAGLLVNAVAVVTLLPKHRILQGVAGGLLVLVGFAFVPGAVTNGYVDVLWAAWFSAAAVWLLLHPVGRDATAVGVLCAAVAVLTKHEAVVACVVLTVLVAARHRHALRQVWPVALVVAAGLGWTAFARVSGAQSDFAAPGSIGALLALDGEVLGRFPPTAAVLGRELWADVARWALVVTAVLAVCRLASVRRGHGIGHAGWLPVAAAALVGWFVVAYLVSRYPIDWHLATSAGRLAVAPRLLLLTEVVLWAGLAAGEWKEARR